MRNAGEVLRVEIYATLLLRSVFLSVSHKPGARFGVFLDEDTQRPVLGSA